MSARLRRKAALAATRSTLELAAVPSTSTISFIPFPTTSVLSTLLPKSPLKPPCRSAKSNRKPLPIFTPWILIAQFFELVKPLAPEGARQLPSTPRAEGNHRACQRAGIPVRYRVLIKLRVIKDDCLRAPLHQTVVGALLERMPRHVHAGIVPNPTSQGPDAFGQDPVATRGAIDLMMNPGVILRRLEDRTCEGRPAKVPVALPKHSACSTCSLSHRSLKCPSNAANKLRPANVDASDLP